MATSWSFEPGSVMKAVTFSGVLDAGLADTTSRTIVPKSPVNSTFGLLKDFHIEPAAGFGNEHDLDHTITVEVADV